MILRRLYVWRDSNYGNDATSPLPPFPQISMLTSFPNIASQIMCVSDQHWNSGGGAPVGRQYEMLLNLFRQPTQQRSFMHSNTRFKHKRGSNFYCCTYSHPLISLSCPASSTMGKALKPKAAETVFSLKIPKGNIKTSIQQLYNNYTTTIQQLYNNL